MTMVHDPVQTVDPLGDGDRLSQDNAKKNYAKVGSARPSSLLYTYGPGAIIDLPHFTVMPTGLDEWDRIWARRDTGPAAIHAPRLLETVQMMLGHQVTELRPFPWQPTVMTYSREGADLGVPARVFPQWLRCTGCDRLATVGAFSSGYKNQHPYRPDEAVFEHTACYGRRGQGKGKSRRQPCVPARYLIACPDGHLDEFPYDWWVHRGGTCPASVAVPELKMVERTGGKGANAIIVCESCQARRTMSEAQGADGRAKLPACRGRFPHLDAFAPDPCEHEPRLMLVGASNLWFAAVQSIIDMPRLDGVDKTRDDATALRAALGDKLDKYADNVDMIRDLLEKEYPNLWELSDEQLEAVVAAAVAVPETDAEREDRRAAWEPVDLLVPEWRYLQSDPLTERHQDERSGLVLSPRKLGKTMPRGISRVLAVDRLRKVNAVLGFTRIDDLDRVNDVGSRLVPLTRSGRPAWVPATQDRGEGVFLQLDEAAVAAWETCVGGSDLWKAHRESFKRNFERRFSETAETTDPYQRLLPPRYWLVHTLSHALIRQMAMFAGYGAASLSERVYAWPQAPGRPAAAGVLIATTASDSDGTLGGLVSLSASDTFAGLVNEALHDLTRCSSDPVCAQRTPQAPEDFLHGAACHCCTMASETSCERANRFLDRRFVVSLPGQWAALGFFGRQAG